MAVNDSSWKSLSIAPRETAFNNDEALARIKAWSGRSAAKYASAFLWRDSDGNSNNTASYRLTVGDIINGKLVLVPHAIFAAASILAGAHGGLEGVVSEEEKLKLKAVVTDIYEKFQDLWGDPRTKPPWLRGGNTEEQVTASLTAAVNSSWDMPVAAVDRPWDAAAAKARVWDLADGDWRAYRRAFLWWDNSNPETKAAYKLPIADVIDGKLTIVPRAVNAVASVLGGGRGGVEIPETDQSRIQGIVSRLQEKVHGSAESSRTAAADPESIVLEDLEAIAAAHSSGQPVVAAAVPVRPASSLFTNPNLPGPTKIAVTPEGEVMGHIAAWGVCHTGIGNQCVMAPRTAAGYRYFLNGTVLTADGTLQPVGKLTLGTGHADTRLGWIPAADHYDNTGTAVAIVAAGEDAYGIWVHGVTVPEATEERVQELRRSPISGDWRRINGNLELVAALAVNSPGYPIISHTASGEPDVIIAAGLIDPDGNLFAAESPVEGEVPAADAAALERLAKINADADKILKMTRQRRLTLLNTMKG